MQPAAADKPLLRPAHLRGRPLFFLDAAGDRALAAIARNVRSARAAALSVGRVLSPPVNVDDPVQIVGVFARRARALFRAAAAHAAFEAEAAGRAAGAEYARALAGAITAAVSGIYVDFDGEPPPVVGVGRRAEAVADEALMRLVRRSLVAARREDRERAVARVIAEEVKRFANGLEWVVESAARRAIRAVNAAWFEDLSRVYNKG